MPPRGGEIPGYEITVQHSNQKITKRRGAVNGSVRLRVPRSAIKASAPFTSSAENPPRTHRWQQRPQHTRHLRSEYRGIVEYCLLASDVYRLNRLNGVMRTSSQHAGVQANRPGGTGDRYKAKIETRAA